jgi:UDP-glucose:glycoprotein glucosyltransferase
MTTGVVSTFISTLVHSGRLSEVPPSRMLEVLADRLDEQLGAFKDELMAGKQLTNAKLFRILQTNRLVARELGLKPGQRCILVNGRVSHLLNLCEALRHLPLRWTARWTL